MSHNSFQMLAIKSMLQTLMMNSQNKVINCFILEPINSMVNTDILLLSKFEK